MMIINGTKRFQWHGEHTCDTRVTHRPVALFNHNTSDDDSINNDGNHRLLHPAAFKLSDHVNETKQR